MFLCPRYRFLCIACRSVDQKSALRTPDALMSKPRSHDSPYRAPARSAWIALTSVPCCIKSCAAFSICGSSAAIRISYLSSSAHFLREIVTNSGSAFSVKTPVFPDQIAQQVGAARDNSLAMILTCRSPAYWVAGAGSCCVEFAVGCGRTIRHPAKRAKNPLS
jgi:hypothetical protein